MKRSLAAYSGPLVSPDHVVVDASASLVRRIREYVSGRLRGSGGPCDNHKGLSLRLTVGQCLLTIVWMITSQGNPRIKEIRKLYNRKYREQTGLAFIEGIRIVAEAVLQQACIEILVVAPELLTSDFGQE